MTNHLYRFSHTGLCEGQMYGGREVQTKQQIAKLITENLQTIKSTNLETQYQI